MLKKVLSTIPTHTFFFTAKCNFFQDLGGKNRRVNISINLVIKKNLLLKELESVADPEKKVELLGLLESVRSRLRSLRKGEHK